MDNLAWGLQMTVLGMGLVFALLAMLWGLLTLMLRLDKPPAAAHAPTDVMPPPAAPSTGPGEAGISAAMVAAIALAVSVHRARQPGAAEPQTRVHLPGSLLHASRWVAAGRQRQTRNWRRGG